MHGRGASRMRPGGADERIFTAPQFGRDPPLSPSAAAAATDVPTV